MLRVGGDGCEALLDALQDLKGGVSVWAPHPLAVLVLEMVPHDRQGEGVCVGCPDRFGRADTDPRYRASGGAGEQRVVGRDGAEGEVGGDRQRFPDEGVAVKVGELSAELDRAGFALFLLMLHTGTVLGGFLGYFFWGLVGRFRVAVRVGASGGYMWYVTAGVGSYRYDVTRFVAVPYTINMGERGQGLSERQVFAGNDT